LAVTPLCIEAGDIPHNSEKQKQNIFRERAGQQFRTESDLPVGQSAWLRASAFSMATERLTTLFDKQDEAEPQNSRKR
jgi:hypothetical protein